MTQEERDAVKEYLTFASEEMRSAQRTIEVMANLLEYIRQKVLLNLGPDYDGYVYRIFDVLSHTRDLERVRMYNQTSKDLLTPEYKQRPPWAEFRWVIMDHIFPRQIRFGQQRTIDQYTKLMAELEKHDT